MQEVEQHVAVTLKLDEDGSWELKGDATFSVLRERELPQTKDVDADTTVLPCIALVAQLPDIPTTVDSKILAQKTDVHMLTFNKSSVKQLLSYASKTSASLVCQWTSFKVKNSLFPLEVR